MSSSRKSIPKSAYAPLGALEAITRLGVSREDSHLVRLRASALNGCRYCTAMHRRDARKDGWNSVRLAAAEAWVEHREGFDVAEIAVLRLTDAVTRIDGEESIPDELWDEVVRHRGDRGAGQLVLEIAMINTWNRIAVSTRMNPKSLKGVLPEDIDVLR